MTETTHTRSRRASLGGLLLQVLAFGVTLVLGLYTHSTAVELLAWYILGGVPLWFVALLVFRQQELAALEALDLEELRREKQAVGGEALFDASTGFRVAENRLRWMQRWLVPAFALLTAVYLGVMGGVEWYWLSSRGFSVGSGAWPVLMNVPIGVVVLVLVMLGLFLYSRYCSGMGRVAEWRLLRACGSYMLGNALLIMAVLVALGVNLYAGLVTWEQVLAYVVPIAMLVLGLEMAVNFVLDIYRPRTPGLEPRAAFDSRLLGLFAEPGGIASSIADAINYQFGFQVSQTWFYQLLERTAVPLVLTGALALWLLTCLVLVQPFEHVIVERFGRQLNAADPLGPGLHLKLPWPIDVARTYNTGQLHQINIGFRQYDASPDHTKTGSVQLWTDEKHLGQEHFDFIANPAALRGTAAPAGAAAATTAPVAAAKDVPVHLIRMDVAVQFKVQPQQLAQFSQTTSDPQKLLREIAWETISRLTASSTVDALLGREMATLGERLRQELMRQVEALGLGLEVVYVGVTNIHPERTVAEAFRNVVKAEQQKIAAIREALVVENEKLAKVAGDAQTARRLADAVESARAASQQLDAALNALRGIDPPRVDAAFERLAGQSELYRGLVEAQARLSAAREARHILEQEAELGLGRTAAERRRAAEAVAKLEAEAAAAAQAVETAVQPARDALARDFGAPAAEALLRGALARAARQYWETELSPTRLEGQAAATLAAAIANRWQIEFQAARELTQVLNERDAYSAAPEIYRARRMMDVLVTGIRDARKYVLAFDPRGRAVRVRYVTDDDVQVEPFELPTDSPR